MTLLDEMACQLNVAVDDTLDAYKATVSKALQQLESDVTAMYSDTVLAALVYLEAHDLQAFERVIHETKQYRIASELRRRIKQKQRNFSARDSVTLPFPNHVNPDQAPGREVKPGFLVYFDMTVEKNMLVPESEAAVLLAEYLQGTLAYSDNTKTWHYFTGTHWKPLTMDSEVDKTLLELLYIGTQKLGFRNTYRNNVKALIADGDMLPLPAIKHDFLPFQNGLLDIKTGELFAITPDNAQSWVLPYEYSPSARCPHIKKWLNDAVDGDQGSVEFLRAWLAAILHGRADLQKFLHLLGRGGSGKGTFFRLAKALIGEHNTATTTLKTMEGNPFETANFHGKRLIVITDSDKYNGSVNILKAITGQDPIRLERKYQQASSFTYEGVVIIASNENLVTTDHTSGIERRRSTVRFDNVFSEDAKLAWESKGGEALLHAELPGLVNWLLALSHDDIGRIIRKPPHRTRQANFDAMTASNPLSEWLTECCIPDPDVWTQIGVKIEIKEPGCEVEFDHSEEWLYPNYLLWCQRGSRAPLALRRFRELTVDAAKTLGVDVFESRRSAGWGIKGIRLCKEWEDSLAQWHG